MKTILRPFTLGALLLTGGCVTFDRAYTKQVSDNPAAKLTAQEIMERVQRAQQQRPAA